jgi:hypothetical protein
MALGAFIIKARLGLTDEEMVEQIKDNPHLQFFIGLETFQYSAPFDPSVMVYFRKRVQESIVNDCNERIIRNGLNIIRSAESEADEDDDNDRACPAVISPRRLALTKHLPTRAPC